MIHVGWCDLVAIAARKRRIEAHPPPWRAQAGRRDGGTAVPLCATTHHERTENAHISRTRGPGAVGATGSSYATLAPEKALQKPQQSHHRGARWTNNRNDYQRGPLHACSAPTIQHRGWVDAPGLRKPVVSWLWIGGSILAGRTMSHDVDVGAERRAVAYEMGRAQVPDE